MRVRPGALLILVLTALTLAAALLPAGQAAAASWTTCRGADPANGITKVRVLRIGCSSGVAVAKRTNSVKCFLNGNRCTHRFRGRAWTCTMSSAGTSVRCRAGRRHVRYRIG